MGMDDKDVENQKKLKGLWNDAKRYQKIQDEVRQAINQADETTRIIPFYRQRYFAIAATIIILIGVSLILVFIIQNPFSNSGKNDLTHGNDTTLKLHMDKPVPKARQEIYRDEIFLKWDNHYDSITHLVILDTKDGKIVFRTEIKPAQQSFLLPKNKLNQGSYNWYVGDNKFTKGLIIEP